MRKFEDLCENWAIRQPQKPQMKHTSNTTKPRTLRVMWRARPPLQPPTRAGGGGSWNDTALCQSMYVVGFRVSAGDCVDGVQFLYANNKWGSVQVVVPPNQ
jgi:hypothetical protein